MSMKRPKARASEHPPRWSASLDRRRFLGAAALACVWPRSLLAAEDAAPSPVSEAARAALPGSEFVYVSPLRSDGSESRCHGEVWYAWLDGEVALITGSDRWKARSVARGLDRARIWVGNYGTWRRGPLRNEDFRKGPSFVARARTSKDAAILERMLTQYDEKYPGEIDKWRERFRQGLASGERVIILYQPVSG